MKGAKSRQYYVATFPFFNTRNSLVYDLVHCTSHEKGFNLFKTTTWKTFGDKSSTKKKNYMEGQLMFDFSDDELTKPPIDEYCYDLDSIATYLQENFHRRKNVPLEDVWSILDKHPVFPSNGYKDKLKSILKLTYSANISQKTITFSEGRG